MVSKQNIIDHLTHSCGLQRASAIRAVDGISKFIADSLASGENVSLRGLGTFWIREVAERPGKDFKTGAAITIPAHKGVKFIPSNNIKDALK